MIGNSPQNRFRFYATSRRIFSVVAVLFVLIYFAGCSSTKTSYKHPRPLGQELQGSKAGGRISTQSSVPYPWELWIRGKDLSGYPLREDHMLAGDDAANKGNFEQAIFEYQKVDIKSLSPTLKDALIMRVASGKLALDKPQEALQQMSEYFRSSNISVNDIDDRFALIFGYAYGRLKDFDQSLAWFSKAQAGAAVDGGKSMSAEEGASLLIRGIPQSNFDTIADHWAGDPFVRRLFGEERNRRAKNGGSFESSSDFDRFWVREVRGTQTQEKLVTAGSKATLSVLLPLSGRYAALGTSAKNGLEVAFDGQQAAGFLNLSFKDTGGSAQTAVDAARAVIEGEKPTALIGPLLSEDASAVSSLARGGGIPIVTFSKNSLFQTGGGIFRLAPTAESQVNSLLDEIEKKVHAKKFAILAPDDASGHEFYDLFKEGLLRRGFELVSGGLYPKDDYSSFVTVAEDFEKKGVEAVFFPDNILAASRFFGAFTSEFRLHLKMLGTVAWDNPTQLQNSRTVLNGVIFPTPFFLASQDPTIVQFIDSYTSKYGKKPDFLAAQAFDAGTLVMTALRTRASNGTPFADALIDIGAYEGLTGEINVESNGEFRRKLTVVRFVDGTLSELKDIGSPTYVVHGNEVIGGDSSPYRLPIGGASKNGEPSSKN